MLNFWYAPMVLLLLLLRGAENSSAQTACGRPQVDFSRIIGGGNAEEGEWPWQVSLRRNREHSCGGALISNQWVLSAAHCFYGPLDPTLFKVNLGEYELTKPASSMISASISQIIVHPYFIDVTFGADIALVKLKEPVKYSRTISPICLPNSSDPDPFSPWMTCFVTGWGVVILNGSIPRKLQKADVQIIDNKECDKMFQNVTRNNTLIDKNMICAGDPKNKKDACMGDSGGPLSCRLNDTWFLAGVVSFGIGCANYFHPGVYTRISFFMDWIQDTMAKNKASWRDTNCASVLFLPLLLVLGKMLFDSP